MTLLLAAMLPVSVAAAGELPSGTPAYEDYTFVGDVYKRQFGNSLLCNGEESQAERRKALHLKPGRGNDACANGTTLLSNK